LTVYGQQEKAPTGYNPKKPGRRSYHPLFCFEGQSGDCWAGELYPGDTHPTSVIIAVLDDAIRKLPPNIRKKFFRGDSACFDKKLVNFLISSPFRGAGRTGLSKRHGHVKIF
jgi:hypothetical protein